MRHLPVLVTDLDNTLYDWVTFYSRAFKRMVESLCALLVQPEDALLAEFKRLHEKYRTSEPPFCALELPSVIRAFPGHSRAELYRQLLPVFDAFNRERDQHLVLYPSVRETLRYLHRDGTRIVGHTEAIPENAFFRLKKLGIADYFSHLYSASLEIPPHPAPGRSTTTSLRDGFLIRLPPEERKPNPRLLLDICNRESVAPSDCYYVGDSLTRDVLMAKQAGAVAVWARYGTKYSPHDWDLLVKVTHWTAEEVAREAERKKHLAAASPDYTIERFEEILTLIPEKR